MGVVERGGGGPSIVAAKLIITSSSSQSVAFPTPYLFWRKPKRMCAMRAAITNR